MGFVAHSRNDIIILLSNIKLEIKLRCADFGASPAKISDKKLKKA